MDATKVEGEERRPIPAARELREWSLNRIDVRTSISGKQWPVARVELNHPKRGRVTDICSAPGAFEALFGAASQIIGVAPSLLSFNVRSTAPARDQSMAIHIDVEVELGGKIYRGSAFGLDLMRSALEAWLEAASKAADRRDGSTRGRGRPFQISGIDENDDLWIFASSDEGAAEAVRTEFVDEGYSDLRAVP